MSYMHIFVSLSGCCIYHIGIESLFFFHVCVLPLGLEASVFVFNRDARGLSAVCDCGIF